MVTLLIVLVVVLVVVVVAVLVAAARLVHRVPPGHVGVVFREGTYLRMVTSGVLLLPLGERVRSVPTVEQQLRLDATPLVADDGSSAAADLRVAYRVDDPVRALTAVHDAAYAVERDALAALRTFAGEVDGAELLASSVRAADRVRTALGPRLHGWGLELLRVEVVVRPGDA